MATVSVKDRDHFEEALARFSYKCQEEKILKECRKRASFITEREKRTAKQKNSCRKLQKNQQKD